MELFTSCLELLHTVLGPPWEVDMDRGSHTSAEVSGAGVNVAVLLIQTEVLPGLVLNRVANGLDASGKSFKDALDISALLHGDDSELILLIDPDEESLGVVVEDASALWPLTSLSGLTTDISPAS